MYDDLDAYLEGTLVVQSAYALAKREGRHISTVTSRLKAKGFSKSIDGSWRRSSQKKTVLEILTELTKCLDQYKTSQPSRTELAFIQSTLAQLSTIVDEIMYGETNNGFD